MWFAVRVDGPLSMVAALDKSPVMIRYYNRYPYGTHTTESQEMGEAIRVYVHSKNYPDTYESHDTSFLNTPMIVEVMNQEGKRWKAPVNRNKVYDE